MSRQISAVPDLCCIVTRKSVESVGGLLVMAMSQVWFGCNSLSACHQRMIRKRGMRHLGPLRKKESSRIRRVIRSEPYLAHQFRHSRLKYEYGIQLW